jgi:2'-5' RNA ligase
MSNDGYTFGLAIKLDISDAAKVILRKILKIARLEDSPRRVKNPHITIGFIAGLSSKEEAEKVGKIATDFLNDYLNKATLNFVVDSCKSLWHHTILVPQEDSFNNLRKLNVILEQVLLEKGYRLDHHTLHENYTPHLSLIKKPPNHHQLKLINQEIEKLKKQEGSLTFSLTNSSLVIIPHK